jgi:hypothetical protein
MARFPWKRRDLLNRPGRSGNPLSWYFWWLQGLRPDTLFDRWVARHVLLRWWCYGTPFGSRTATGSRTPRVGTTTDPSLILR